MNRKYDLAVVGAGIIGLACALAAARRGLSVIVVERDTCAKKASVRNFGFITITGQHRETVWPRALRARDVWQDVAARAGIPIVQRGQWIAARRPEAAAVLEAFLRTDMGEACELLSVAQAEQRCSHFRTPELRAVLWSPHEIRVESREAIPRVAQLLGREFGVEFRWETAVHSAVAPKLETSRGPIAAESVVICPGDDLVTLFPERLSGIGRCMLQMMRLESPGFALPGTITSDLTLARYAGFANLPEAGPLRQRLMSEQPEFLEHDIHLIVAQASDGSLIVGDSHHDVSSGEPFALERINELLREEYQSVMGHPAPRTRECWIGTYATAKGKAVVVEAPDPNTRLVVITSGVGASIGFAVGEEVINELYD
jgi:FAD dependent oxidoreductase TIGR03364